MEISLYLKRPDAEAETAIFARISYSGNKLKYYLPEKIHPKNWNKDSQQARESKKFLEYPEFNARLKNLKGSIANTFRKYVNDHQGILPNPQTLKVLLDQSLKKVEAIKEPNKAFFPFYDQFVQRSKDGARISLKSKRGTVYNTTKGYISTLNHLKEFQSFYSRKIDFTTIDLEFYNDYVKYLTQKVKLSNNTIGDHIKRIKTVLNEATEMGLNMNMSFRSRYFATITEQTDSIYLTDLELKEIEKLDLSDNTKLDRVRDLFLVGCYSGLRYSDLAKLRPDNIGERFIEITQLKTGNGVVIPIHPVVTRILNKYNGQFPKSISNQKTNDYLKEVGQKVPSLCISASISFTKGGSKITKTCPKWQLLTTHTARRSFATNQYIAGVPTLTLMFITGHRTEKAFLRYIKKTSNDHAKELEMTWKHAPELKVV